MGKKSLKPGQLRRVGGVAMLSVALGILLSWALGGVSIAIALLLLVLGFYFLFM